MNMNYKQVQQMRKQAALPDWFRLIGSGGAMEENAADPAFSEQHGRLYDNLKEFEDANLNVLTQNERVRGNAPTSGSYPGENARRNGFFTYIYSRPKQPTPEDRNLFQRFGDKLTSLWKKPAPPESPQPSQPSPTDNAWSYTIYGPGQTNTNSEGVNFILYPDELPNARYGKAMIEDMYRAKGLVRPEGNYEIPENQPLTVQQWMAYQAGDPDYIYKRLAHLRAIDPKHFSAGNVVLSDDNELKAWGDYVPVTSWPSLGAGYDMTSGKIMPYSQAALQELNRRYHTQVNDTYFNTPVPAVPSRMSGIYNSAHTLEALFADAAGHEFNHGNNTGTSKLGKRPYPYLENVSMGEDTGRFPWGERGIPAYLRMKNPSAIYFTSPQDYWLRGHEVDPYALDEREILQAFDSFNAGRYRLAADIRKDMEGNLGNRNYAQIDPEIRQQFIDLPQFVQPGEEGAKQLDSIMSFYAQNPQFIVMMPEQARLVGYYYNLKAALENSKDPVEKEFFQKLMNRMIYSKSFLANNQQNRTTYTDVQRMMA